MTYDEIILTIEAPIAFLTLNNPKKINALSKRMIAELMDALPQAVADETVKVVIIRAQGAHFCAGHLLSEMVDQEPKEYQFIFDQCSRFMQMIHQAPIPVIAQVQGIATAAGCQLAAWCDLVVAETGARFATPGVKIGLFCTTPMVALSRAIGRKAALEMLLTGRYVEAQEAKTLGLINHVTSPDQLARETERLALKIAEASRFVLGIGKRAFYAQIDQTDDQAMDYAKNTMMFNNLAHDAQIGIKAFLDKQTPQWKNG